MMGIPYLNTSAVLLQGSIENIHDDAVIPVFLILSKHYHEYTLFIQV